MRFASRYGRMVVEIQRLIAEEYATGGTKVLQQAVLARFEPVGLQPFERELVLTRWGGKFNGSYQEMDEVTIVPPDYRIGVYDSVQQQEQNQWPDELRLKVEEKLLALEKTEDVIALPKTTVPAPWPAYDGYQGSIRQLLKKLDEDGHNLQDVLTYERASQNRQALVDALQSKLGGFELEEETPKEEEIVA